MDLYFAAAAFAALAWLMFTGAAKSKARAGRLAMSRADAFFAERAEAAAMAGNYT